MAKKKQRRGLTDESDTPFSSRAVLTRGRGAVNAWFLAVYGLIPGLGIILGPLATLVGLWVRWKHRNNPEHKGRSLAKASILLGAALWVTTWAGVALIWMALSK